MRIKEKAGMQYAWQISEMLTKFCWKARRKILRPIRRWKERKNYMVYKEMWWVFVDWIRFAQDRDSGGLL
jgi:hypothetical protein